MSDKRSEALSTDTLSSLFNSLHGYYDSSGWDLSLALVNWDLLDENNQKDELVIARYIKWSFSVSFLELVNAWQWFLAGTLLGNQAHMPAQIMQMYYYAIFFSCDAFLSAQFKGQYTLELEFPEKHASRGCIVKKKRKEIWVYEPHLYPYGN